MGYYGCNILDHQISVGDFEFDYIKKSGSKSYYESYRMDCEYKNPDGNTKTVKIPLTSFGKIKKRKDKFYFQIDWKKSWFAEFLFDYLQKHKVDISGYLFHYVHNLEDDDGLKYFFLTSELGNDHIILSNKVKKMYTVKTYNELKWIQKFGFNFSNNIYASISSKIR